MRWNLAGLLVRAAHAEFLFELYQQYTSLLPFDGKSRRRQRKPA